MSQNGRVVWHDCMTPDVDQSISFYTQLFGWTIEEVTPEGGKPYKMMKNGEETIGGFVPLDEKAGLPPHWISYVAVDSIDDAMKRVETAGGEIGVPPMDIPSIGKFAVIKDPTGGYISPFQSAHGPAPEREGASPVGNFIWEELLTSDPVKASGFYGELFGWSTEEMDMGEMGTYRVQNRGEIPEAGIMQKPKGAPGPTAWLSYVHVDNVDTSAAQVKTLGGKTVVEPFDIPNIGRMSVHSDPVGGVFALYKPAQQ